MLEEYFVRPATVDRIRGSWLGQPIEQYVGWLAQQGYRPRNVFRRVPVLMRFGEFARAQGATSWDELPVHVTPFVELWVREHAGHCRTQHARDKVGAEARGPVEQLVRMVVAGYRGRGRPHVATEPFADSAPGFFDHLRQERGLRESSVYHYGHYLRGFAAYLRRIELPHLTELSPAVLSAFVIDRSPTMSKTTMTGLCSALRVFLRYLHREGLVGAALWKTVQGPRTYRLSDIPRSIGWSDVRRTLAEVDRRSPAGKRDYAMLLLLSTYGLRAREIAALTLDDFHWKSERLQVPGRKAGHSTTYPLSPVVGEAVLEYLRQGRPHNDDRHLFLRVLAPHRPVTHGAVSARAGHYLRRAGITVPRAGSHTLRHSCVQRLVDADFSLKEIGDYIGHRSPEATRIYAKVAVESLREMACSDGEAIV